MSALPGGATFLEVIIKKKRIQCSIVRTMAGALPKEGAIYPALYYRKNENTAIIEEKKPAKLQPKIEWKQLKLKGTFKWVPFALE